jgi:hypothetical protein
MTQRLEIQCPCCDTRLVVDGETGDILSEERPKMDVDKTFDSAMREVQDGAAKRADAFDKAFDRTQRLDDVLSRKFEEAKKKAAKDTSKPRNPFDME